jgi:Fur family transcriptional regulator, peroxide stress response regulator
MFKLKPEIATAFRACGLRCTPQRYAVFHYLMKHPVHATADEIYGAVNRSDPRSSRATVYNNLHALIEAGLVREVHLEGKSVRFDANIKRHHHFVCDRCGKVEDIEWFDFPQLARRSPLGSRVIRDYEMILRGTCQGCSRKHFKLREKETMHDG